MYSVDENDRVVELADFPKFSIGAPCPVVTADEWTVILAYYLRPHVTDRDEPKTVTLDTEGESAALLRFDGAEAHILVPSSESDIERHPLARRGLEQHRAFEILNSSWIRELQRIQSLYIPAAQPRQKRARHFVFAFHDSTFECIAKRFSIEVHQSSSIRSLMPRMADMLSRSDECAC